MMRGCPNLAWLIGDMALGIVKLRLRAHEGAMRGQPARDAVLTVLLGEI